jgi:hypothetical protein
VKSLQVCSAALAAIEPSFSIYQEKTGKYCLECSADVATSILLTTEIDAATLAGQDAANLLAEFSQLSTRLLERAQST